MSIKTELIIAFFISFAIFESNPTLGAGTFVVLSGILLVRKFLQSKKIREKQLKQRIEAQLIQKKRIQDISHAIKKYLQAYTAGWQVWPAKIILNPEDYASIRSLVTTEDGLDTHSLNDADFANLVDACLYQLKFALFEENFKRVVAQPLSKHSMLDAYIKEFEQNTSFIPLLVAFAGKRQIPLTEAEIKTYIHQWSQNEAIQKRAAAIKEALDTHQPLQHRTTINEVDQMDGIAFERLLGDLYTQMGYEVTYTKASGDQGADLLLTKGGERKIIQAKRYKDDISNTAVQEAVAAKAFYKIPHTAVATNRYFTKGAKDLAAANGVELIDRDILCEWLKVYPIYH